jgi:hypothetical protein
LCFCFRRHIALALLADTHCSRCSDGCCAVCAVGCAGTVCGRRKGAAQLAVLGADLNENLVDLCAFRRCR